MKTIVEIVNLQLSCLEPSMIPGSLGLISLVATIESFAALLLQSIILPICREPLQFRLADLFEHWNISLTEMPQVFVVEKPYIYGNK